MIIEYGFATDENDTNRLLYSWNELAESVVKSIAEYLKVEYKEPSYKIYNVKNGDSLYLIAKKFNKLNHEVYFSVIRCLTIININNQK